MVRIRGSHPRDPGSSPGDGITSTVDVLSFYGFEKISVEFRPEWTPVMQGHKGGVEDLPLSVC